MSERKCVEPDCDEPAGTPWGPYWCPTHDRERLDRISANLDAMAEVMGVPGSEEPA